MDNKCICKCCLLKSSVTNYCIALSTNLSIEANSVGPDQTVPLRAVLSGSTLFIKEAFEHYRRQQNQTTFAVIAFLRVKDPLGH